MSTTVRGSRYLLVLITIGRARLRFHVAGKGELPCECLASCLPHYSFPASFQRLGTRKAVQIAVPRNRTTFSGPSLTGSITIRATDTTMSIQTEVQSYATCRAEHSLSITPACPIGFMRAFGSSRVDRHSWSSSLRLE
jgi:hypothetical protein